MRTALFFGGLCSGFGLGGQALAQPLVASAVNAPTAAVNTQVAAADAPAAAANAPASGLEEIVVTAQRRSQSQQNVPISISVASAKQIAAAGLISAQELSVLTPGLNLSYSRNAVTPYLRGIGTQNNLPGTEQAVAVYVDGVYYPAPAASIFAFNNIERVEVLKGPQGTLFGRNATGGLIHIITRDPSETTEADATMSYGNYDTLAGSAYVTGKLANGVAADLAFTASNQGTGFGRNLYLGNEVGITRRWAVRSKIKAELSPSDTLILSADYSSQVTDAGDGERQTAPGYVSVGGYTHIGGKYDSNSDIPFDYPGNRGYFYGASAKYSHDFTKDITLTSLTSYRYWHVPSFTDADATPHVLSEAMFRVRGDSFQEELLLNGKSGRLEWTVLGFYLNSREGNQPIHVFTVPNSPQNVVTYSMLPTISYAGAAQGTYAITPTTHLTLGGRYTEDQKSIRGTTTAAAGNSFPVGTLISCTTGIAGCLSYVPAAQTSTKYNAFTWRAALDQKLAPAVLLYISANRGFKAGAYNASTITAPPVKPEHLTAFEGGIKADITRDLRFNASAFYYKYTGIQLSATVPPLVVPQIYNAAAGRVKGLDLEGIWSPQLGDGRLTLRGAASILDPKYTSFPGAPSYTPVTVNGVQTGGDIVGTINASGRDFIRAARFSSSASGNYDVPVSALLKLGMNVTWEYNGGFYWNPDNGIKQNPYSLVNAQLSLGRKDESWTARLWVKNLTNTYYDVFFSSGSLGNTAVPGDPRTYGLAVDIKY